MFQGALTEEVDASGILGKIFFFLEGKFIFCSNFFLRMPKVFLLFSTTFSSFFLAEYQVDIFVSLALTAQFQMDSKGKKGGFEIQLVTSEEKEKRRKKGIRNSLRTWTEMKGERGKEQDRS